MLLDLTRDEERLFRARVEYDILPHSMRQALSYTDYEPEDVNEDPQDRPKAGPPRRKFRTQLPRLGAVITLHGRPNSSIKHLCPVWPAVISPTSGMVTLTLQDGTQSHHGPDIKWSYKEQEANA